nr:TPA_asm: hypothetical protein HUJ06_028617 [Nelumbo nucifera]
MGKWLSFAHVNGLTINGPGYIDGQGSTWWKQSCENNELYATKCQRPTALLFNQCNGLRVDGLHHVNSAKNHISIHSCNDVTLNQLKVTAPKDSPNTDGVDISNSTYVRVMNSDFETGDDCIAINSGSSFINITYVNCGPGHGISVGSLGVSGSYATVEEVHVEHCNFFGTQAGARIKTWQGGSGYAKRISFNAITVKEVDHPIIIDQYYCPHDKCENTTSAVEVSDVTYSGIIGSSTSEDVISLRCSESVACTNIVMNYVNITTTAPGKEARSYCLNAHGSSKNTNPPVSCL